MGNWISNELCDLTEENLSLLIDHKVPGILVKNFIDKETCNKVAERLIATNFGGYDHLKDIPVYQLGVCHNQFAHDEKSVYFGAIAEAQKIIDDIYRNLDINPVEMVMDYIRNNSKRVVDIYEEEGYGRYFAGAFRSFKGHGKLHADHAPSHINADWEVTKLIRQLTWNIYYCIYEKGGEAVIYDTIHTKENDVMKVENGYYFPYDVLEREDHVRVKPEVGDLLLFNTQNFHEILGHDKGSRISQTSFIGVTKGDELRLWS